MCQPDMLEAFSCFSSVSVAPVAFIKPTDSGDCSIRRYSEAQIKWPVANAMAKLSSPRELNFCFFFHLFLPFFTAYFAAVGAVVVVAAAVSGIYIL